MIRAALGSQAYWNSRVSFREGTIAQDWTRLEKAPENPAYEPQFTFDLAKYISRLQLMLYSGGWPIMSLPQHVPPLLEAWELSNRLSDALCAERGISSCRDWSFSLSDLNHYNWCFWLVGLALALEIDDDQWHRLLALIGGEGEDILLDRVIAARQPDRVVGSALLHARPYARLLKAIDAPAPHQARLLRDFVDHWYVELARKGREELWWYIYGDPVKHPLSMGSYFGRWCIEAVAAVKAFGMDDRLCWGHEHYPGDLLRPDGPSTHAAHGQRRGSWLSRWFGPADT